MGEFVAWTRIAATERDPPPAFPSLEGITVKAAEQEAQGTTTPKGSRAPDEAAEMAEEATVPLLEPQPGPTEPIEEEELAIALALSLSTTMPESAAPVADTPRAGDEVAAQEGEGTPKPAAPHTPRTSLAPLTAGDVQVMHQAGGDELAPLQRQETLQGAAMQVEASVGDADQDVYIL